MPARRLLWLLLVLPAVYLAYCATHIPGGPDIDVANQVGRYIAAGYGKFDERSQVERTGRGKIYYNAPGSSQSPIITLYEVTDPNDVARIESLAREALQAIPDAREVELRFHERQNLSFSPGGGASRGRQSPFKTVHIARQ